MIQFFFFFCRKSSQGKLQLQPVLHFSNCTCFEKGGTAQSMMTQRARLACPVPGVHLKTQTERSTHRHQTRTAAFHSYRCSCIVSHISFIVYTLSLNSNPNPAVLARQVKSYDMTSSTAVQHKHNAAKAVLLYPQHRERRVHRERQQRQAYTTRHRIIPDSSQRRARTPPPVVLTVTVTLVHFIPLWGAFLSIAAIVLERKFVLRIRISSLYDI